jgi:hypothetical protein
LDSNPLSGFYSDSAYEFDFGSDPEDPESEDNTPEHQTTLTTRKARRRTMETTTTSKNLTRPSMSSSEDYPAGGSKRLPVEKL